MAAPEDLPALILSLSSPETSPTDSPSPPKEVQVEMEVPIRSMATPEVVQEEMESMEIPEWLMVSPKPKEEEIILTSPIERAEIHALHEEVTEFDTKYRYAIDCINNTCKNLNNTVAEVLEKRSSSAALYIGKEVAPLLGSLKTMGDEIFEAAPICKAMFTKLELLVAVSDMERNSQQLESMGANMQQYTETLQTAMKLLKKPLEMKEPLPQESNLSSASSEISSFKSKDIVTSSPFESFENTDEETPPE